MPRRPAMNRQPSCGGRRRDACPRPGVTPLAAGAVRAGRSWAPFAALLLCMGLWIGVVPSGTAGAAEVVPQAPLKAALLPVGAPPPLAECPAERNVCIRSEERGEFDVRTGTADLSGNVRGYIRAQRLSFTSERLKAQREGKQSWRRIELSGAVQLTQPGRRIVSDHAVIEPNVATAYGKVRLDDERRWGEGDELIIEQEPRRFTLKGTPAHLLTLFVADTSARGQAAAKAQGQAKADTPAQSDAPVPNKSGQKAAEKPGEKPADKPTVRPVSGTLVQAQRAVSEERSRQLFLTGAVNVNMGVRSLTVTAASVTVQFNAEHEVQGFQARGNVVITQPGRLLLGDSARTLNQMQTIVLQGKARMQQEGQFDLSSERLEVFTDTKRGAVRSEDRQRPMSLFLDLKSRNTWRLDASRLARLREQEVSEEVIRKLEPMAGLTFSNQDAFQKSVKQRLTDEESERYLPTIVNQARP
jgi:lipopolysaccharide export system protein LptA